MRASAARRQVLGACVATGPAWAGAIVMIATDRPSAAVSPIVLALPVVGYETAVALDGTLAVDSTRGRCTTMTGRPETRLLERTP